MAVSCHYLEKGNNTSELQTPLKVYRYFFAFLTILHSFLFFFFLSQPLLMKGRLLKCTKARTGTT